MSAAIFKVVGTWRYREHKPGETFVANLDDDVEKRAIRAGAIKVIERLDMRVDPARCKPPKGWAA